MAAIDEWDEKWKHSNFGATIDFCAPGVHIRSPTVGPSNSEYTYSTGTSAAAPFVSGIIAQMLSENGPMRPGLMKQMLYEWSLARPRTGFESSPHVRIIYNGSGR